MNPSQTNRLAKFDLGLLGQTIELCVVEFGLAIGLNALTKSDLVTTKAFMMMTKSSFVTAKPCMVSAMPFIALAKTTIALAKVVRKRAKVGSGFANQPDGSGTFSLV